MNRSTDRLLATHTGSLPRPDDLVRMIWDKMDGKPVDAEELDSRVRSAVDEAVRRQRDIGLDLISDGEMSKPGFSNYVHERFSGFAGRVQMGGADLDDFPGLAAKLFANDAGAHIVLRYCTGPIELTDPDAVFADIDHLASALDGADRSSAFMNAPTPGQIVFNNPNRYYPSHEAYLEAAADAMRHEYRAIIEAGLDLQLDSPDLAMAAHFRSEGTDIGDFHVHVEQAIAALNHALAGIPSERVRLHICWGNYPGPHHCDVALAEIIGPVLSANADVLSFEAANPRHEHEYELFADVRLPDGKVLMPGVIDVQTNRIEHPRLIAQRLIRFAELVGRENVIAGTDCGLGTFVGWNTTDPEIGWKKLESLVEGARLASAELWP